MFLESIERMTPQADGQPEIMRLFAYGHPATQHLSAFTQAVMRGPSQLSVGEREAIAAVTSKLNHCDF